MSNEKTIRARLVLLWQTKIEPADGVFAKVELDIPTETFENKIIQENSFFDLDAFYACDEPDDYDTEDGAHSDFVQFFERKGNISFENLDIVSELGLPYRIFYDSSEFVEVEEE